MVELLDPGDRRGGHHFPVGDHRHPVADSVKRVQIVCDEEDGEAEGLQVQGTAQSVGERTTSAVVQAISLVIVLDAMAALWFMVMDI